MSPVGPIVLIVLISALNVVAMAGAAMLAITGDGRGDFAKVVFGVGCVVVLAFAMLDIARTLMGLRSWFCLLAVPSAVGVLFIVVIVGHMMGVPGW